jgi:hypothetical protein
MEFSEIKGEIYSIRLSKGKGVIKIADLSKYSSEENQEVTLFIKFKEKTKDIKKKEVKKEIEEKKPE